MIKVTETQLRYRMFKLYQVSIKLAKIKELIKKLHKSLYKYF